MSEEVEKMTNEEWSETWKTTGWKESLPEDLAKEPALAKYFEGDYNEIPKAYVNLSKAFGDKAPKPKTDWSKEEADEWNDKYNPGFPKEDTEYDLELTDIPDSYKTWQGENYSEAEKQFRKLAHKNGLTLSQANRIWAESRKSHVEAFEEIRSNESRYKADQQAELKKAYGSDYDDKMKLANSILNKFFDEEDLKAMSLESLPSGAWKSMVKVAESFKEGNIDIEAEVSGPGPNEVRKEIGELMRNPAYSDKYHPDNKEYINKVIALNKKITGE